MKHLLLPAICLLIFTSVEAQQTISIGTKVNTGVGVQSNKLRNAYGIIGAFESSIKKVKGLKFTAGFNAGVFGSKEMPYELRFNGSITNTKVHYTSYLVQLTSGLKYIIRQDKAWTPYVGLSGGLMSYCTNMTIEDPDDPDGCIPIESKPILFSNSFIGTAESGIRIRPKQRGSGSIAFIEIGAQYIRGSKAKYLRFQSEDDQHDNGEEYMMTFKQNSTGLQHDHKLATIYKTPTNQLAFHAALIFKL